MVDVAWAMEPLTVAVREHLARRPDGAERADWLFLERWELAPPASPGTTLRAGQIRRGNPALAAAIRAEVAGLGGKGPWGR